MINNAGIASKEAFHSASFKNHTTMIDINFSAIVHGTHLFLQQHEQGSTGLIINIASMAGLIPLTIDPVYSATKAAVRQSRMHLYLEQTVKKIMQSQITHLSQV